MHVVAYSHVSLTDFLAANGYQALDVVPRFMPLTVKSRLPVSPWLIGTYLASPIKPLEADARARKTDTLSGDHG